MIAIGNGEGCPFCNMDDLDGNSANMFVMEEGKDFLKHLLEKHSEKAEEYLFGNKNINL